MQLDVNNLPVPCDRLVEGNWVNDPYQVAFPIPVAAPETTAYLQAVAQGLCTLLQGQAKQGYVSAFAYNLFSRNGYNNEVWLAVLSDCYDLATKIQTCNPNATPDQVLTTAIRKYHPYAVANCVNHFPILQQLLPQQQVMGAIQAANAYRNEVQQLDVNYQRMQAAVQNQQSGLLNIGGQQQNALPGMAQAQLIGGLAALGSPLNIFQEESSGEGSWGSQRRRPAADSGLETAKETVQIAPRATLESSLVSLQEQTFKPLIVDTAGGVSLMETQDLSLTPRRARRAEVQHDVNEAPDRTSLATASAEARPARVQSVEEANMALAQVSLDDLDIGEPQPVADIGGGTPPVVERPQLRLRDDVEEALKPTPTVVAAPQYQPRQVVVPLSLRVLPASIDEVPDAISACDMRHGVERQIPSIIQASPIGDVEEGKEEPFGTFLGEGDWLIQVVSANDGGWSPSEAQTMRCVYDPLKWHRALVQAMGEGGLIGPVFEGFIEIKEGDNMDLIDLEIDPVRRAQLLAKMDEGKNYIPLAGELLEVTYIERQLLPIGSHHSLEKQERIAIEAGKAEAKPKSARYSAPRGKRKEANVTCVELSNVLAESDTPYLAATMPASSAFRARAWSGDTRLSVKANGRPTRYLRDQVAEMLPVLPALAKQLDRLLAADVNEVLLYGFGYEAIEVSSFVGDYADLVDHLLEKYSEDIVAQFEEGVDDRLRRWSITDDGKEIAVDGDALCVAVNCNLEDMGVNLLSETLAIYTLSYCPNLANIVAFGQACEANAVSAPVIYYTGRDGEIWKAHPSVFDPSMALLIRQ